MLLYVVLRRQLGHGDLLHAIFQPRADEQRFNFVGRKANLNIPGKQRGLNRGSRIFSVGFIRPQNIAFRMVGFFQCGQDNIGFTKGEAGLGLWKFPRMVGFSDLGQGLK